MKQTAHDQPERWNAVAAAYDAAYSTPRDLAEDDVTRSIISPLMSEQSVLDLGCGTGWLLAQVPCLTDYVGVDSSTGMLARAREKWPQHCWIHGDVNDPHVLARFGWTHRAHPFAWVASMNASANYIADWAATAEAFPGARLALGFLAAGRTGTWVNARGIHTAPARYASLRQQFPKASIDSYGGLWSRYLNTRPAIRAALLLERAFYRRRTSLSDKAVWHLVLTP